jgi:hypothetical protein
MGEQAYHVTSCKLHIAYITMDQVMGKMLWFSELSLTENVDIYGESQQEQYNTEEKKY